MFIKKVILKNYRIYYGENEISFLPDRVRNIYLISGENGFGKTTFLTSLVWCFYGKLMIYVDEKYKQEINEAGGYKKYASSSLNRQAVSELEASYSVSVVLSDIFIPSIPCQELQITRTYMSSQAQDVVEILIDGQKNELTKEVGADIFVNDFVLPKEIAKFFFFDAEKIVALAEMKNIEDKRRLSTAYSEVLGIQKYEDLKNNLENLRIRLRRNSATSKEKDRLKILEEEVTDIRETIATQREKITLLEEEKQVKKKQSEQCQEKLIREGNSLTVEELIALKKDRDQLSEEFKQIRVRMKELLELAPFAICGNRLTETRQQARTESKLSNIDPMLIKEKINKIKVNLRKQGIRDKKLLAKLEKLINDEFMPNEEKDSSVLLGFSTEEHHEFESIYTHLTSSYSNTFKQLVRDAKNNRVTFNKIVRKITGAEAKEDDALIQRIRTEKEILDDRIDEIEEGISELNQEIGGLQRELEVKSRQLSELSKKIQLDRLDEKKDKLTKKVIDTLNSFIYKLKLEKKKSLEERIKRILNLLMHKQGFIHRVEVEVEHDIIDVHLYGKENNRISKESLSKGEQQLYATAILKSLVDESDVSFPVFIDSPLQKFDKHHSNNIIHKFYPNVSKQVVLFPLLEKELTEKEYNTLLPKVNAVHLIKNVNEHSSTFEEIDKSELFSKTKKECVHTY